MEYLTEKSREYIVDDWFLDKEGILSMLEMQKALLIEEDLFASIEECVAIWSTYSNNLSASWLDVPKVGIDILKSIKSDSYFISYLESTKIN